MLHKDTINCTRTRRCQMHVHVICSLLLILMSRWEITCNKVTMVSEVKGCWICYTKSRYKTWKAGAQTLVCAGNTQNLPCSIPIILTFDPICDVIMGRPCGPSRQKADDSPTDNQTEHGFPTRSLTEWHWFVPWNFQTCLSALQLFTVNLNLWQWQSVYLCSENQNVQSIFAMWFKLQYSQNASQRMKQFSVWYRCGMRNMSFCRQSLDVYFVQKT